jgi:hypothetical protein
VFSWAVERAVKTPAFSAALKVGHRERLALLPFWDGHLGVAVGVNPVDPGAITVS